MTGAVAVTPRMVDDSTAANGRCWAVGGRAVAGCVGGDRADFPSTNNTKVSVVSMGSSV